MNLLLNVRRYSQEFLDNKSQNFDPKNSDPQNSDPQNSDPQKISQIWDQFRRISREFPRNQSKELSLKFFKSKSPNWKNFGKFLTFVTWEYCFRKHGVY